MQTESILEQVLGTEALASLSFSRGGCDLSIPLSLECQSGIELVQLIGRDAAKRLIAWGHGSRVYIPRRIVSERQRRAEEIADLRRQGLSVHQIARQYRFESRLSERQIFSILRSQNA